ncbi:MAG: hypothetical protein LWW77_08720, partial [Propionibacteriales bacterium]|nr:hypothetical protein [Propionibacteriales bacterium]
MFTSIVAIAQAVARCAVLPAVAVAEPSVARSLAISAVTLPVEGYLMDDAAAIGHLQTNIAAISIVGIDGVSLTSSGARLTATPDISAEAIALAHRNHKLAELLLS